MKIFTLENEYIKVNFLSLGATIVDLIKKSNQVNYVLRYDNIDQYTKNSYYFGVLIGRNAGRTFPARYRNYLNEKIELDLNEGNKHLHGGKYGLHMKEFEVVKKSNTEYSLFLEDNQTLYEKASIEINYCLEGNRFIYKIKGTSQVPTIFNLTNHTYFNLNQDKTKGIEEHIMRIDSDRIQLIDDNYIPNGKIGDLGNVENKEWNFKNNKQIYDCLAQNSSLSKICSGGIDLAYLFKEGLNFEKEKIHLQSLDRTNQLKIYSNQSSCVVYTLNKINEAVKINAGKKIKKHHGITFEMQKEPNFIHSSSECLENEYKSITVYEIM
ncbi:aldose 1-epimerase [Vagococcus lutrae]|uniref:aldose epimerase family protein n=1 Tax=Vagococcus lutrae TaxID=81947 RepID=UPI00192887BC|nr:hypothetical protein [Vagococcus lutrae]GEQ62510.1 aldose 1-epimerase [Vagococcus lutrae]GEQ64405.1 aldose 1-epimerase [Vagococcus lutrae]GEQ66296.1 aldose 1-epimerase [Vagococcus lutrae]